MVSFQKSAGYASDLSLEILLQCHCHVISIRPPSRKTAANDYHLSHSQAAKCRILIDWSLQTVKVYTGSDKSVTWMHSAASTRSQH